MSLPMTRTSVRSLTHLICKNILVRKYSKVKPWQVSRFRTVPSHIPQPKPPTITDYSIFRTEEKYISIKNLKQIEGMRESCRLASEILSLAGSYVKQGVTTDEIDAMVHESCLERCAYPSPLLYRSFPKSCCTSVNNVCCHGIPDSRPLEDGDIINIDITVFYKGFHGDTSATYTVGEVDIPGRKLIDTARTSMNKAIARCGPGEPFSVIGKEISKICSKLGFDVIPGFCGHGIGEEFHCPPDIVHIVAEDCSYTPAHLQANDLVGRMQSGMTFTIEPIITEGDPAIEILPDGWTAVSLDDSRSAQFEHTILITPHGAEILTR